MNDKGQKKILLVEDSMITALAEASMIMKNGYEVICIPDGETAVELALEDGTFDLILMDIDLGSGIDGPTAADLIVKKRNIPIVFLTSHSEQEVVDKVRSITRYGYVIKDSGDFVILSSIEMAFELFEAHRKTKESEENFRQLAASKNEAFAISDVSMEKLIYLSPAIFEIFEIDTTHLVQISWLDVFVKIIHPDDLPEIIKAKKQLLEKQQPYSGEYRIICNNGRIKWIRGKAFPVFNNSGILIRYAAYAEDVTVEKSARKDFFESESKFRSYIENAPIGITITDSRGKFIEINPLAAEGLGYSEKELLKLSIKDIIDPSHKKIAENYLETVFETGCAERDILFRKKDGSLLWLQINSVKLGAERFMAFCQDITSRKKAEILLYKSEERMRSIFDNLPIGIFQSTLNGKFVYLNSHIAKMLGYDSTAELIERVNTSSIADVIYADPEKRLLLVSEASSEPGSWKVFDNRFRRKDGVILDTIISFCERPDPINGENFLYGYVIDVTGKITAEKEIQQLLNEKDLLLKEVNHRIKNNMSAVAALLYLQSESIQDPAAVSALDDARNRIMSMMLIYDKLYRTIDYKNVDFTEYVSNLIDEISLMFNIEGRRIAIEKAIGDFHLDSQAVFPIGIIINEIITNSFKHAFPGRNEGVIHVSISREQASLRIIVKDNGVGIPDSFDIKTAEGFGLGLVNILVQQMNGSLEILKNDGAEYRIVIDVG